MADSQIRFILSANVDQLKKSVADAKGDFATLASAIRTAIAKLPKDGVMGDAFKQSIKDANALLKMLDRLQAKQAAGGKATPRENLIAQGKTQEFTSNLGGATQKALFDEQAAAIAKMSLAEKQAFVESNRGNKQKSAVIAEANRQIRAETKATQDALKVQAAQEKANADELKKISKEKENIRRAETQALTNQQKALKQQMNTWITYRYALYDVASTLRQGGQALEQYVRTAVGAAIAQEAAFSKIEKTQVGVDPKILAVLKKELQDLSTEIPRTFDELASIGMLGAQLGIAADDLGAFTEIVAKFSTVTGVTVEETALAFGKLASLLKVPASEFEALGSAIALVGVQGASTEQQILSTAKQIGAVGEAAGFSAPEVVGLASAMASLGIAPEEARGVLIPTFQEMSRAVSTFNKTSKKGNESLKIFAQIAGVSAEEFSKAWSDKEGGGAAAIFQDFVEGLGRSDVSASLDKIGLSGIRTSKGLTALANNTEFLREQIEAASRGFAESTFLDGAFAKTVEDIASKITMMESSFQNLFAAMSGNEAILAPLGAILDIIIMVNKAITDFANSSRIGPIVLAVVTAIVALGAGLLTLGSMIAVAVGGMLALRVASINAIDTGASARLALFGLRLSGMKTEAALAAIALRGTGAAAEATKVSLLGASGAAGVLKVTLRGLLASTGIGIAAVGIGLLLEGLLNLIPQAEEADKATQDTSDSLGEMARKAGLAGTEVDELASKIKELVDESTREIDAAAAVEDALFNLGKSLAENGKGFDVFSESGRSNISALSGVVDAITAQADGDVNTLYTTLMNFMMMLQQEGKVSADGLAYLKQTIDAISGEVFFPKMPTGDFGTQSIDAGSKSIDKFTGSAGRAKTALEKLKETIDKTFRRVDAAVDMRSSIDSLGKSLLENGSSFSVFSESGRSNLNALRDTIDALSESSNGNKRVFSSNLNALKAALIQAGIAGPRAIQLINKALKAVGVNAKASQKQIREFKRSLDSLRADRVIAVADAIENLSNKVMNYLNARWMLGNLQMEIAAGWEQISQSADKAAGSVEDVSDELNKIAANRQILEYQLQVALKYGDTLRANEIRAEIAALDAEKQRILDDARRAAEEAAAETKTPQQDLLQQQQALQQMVGYYVQMGSAEVISAKNKTQAKKAVEETVTAFEEQARAAGVSEENVAKYSAELRKGLNLARELNKPVKYKVNAATKAALDEIRNFRDRANDMINSIKGTVTITVKTVPAKAAGGLITTNAYASGGKVVGPGTGTSDSILARVSNGEYVVRAAAVKNYGLDFMNALNNSTLAPRPFQTTPAVSGGGMGEQIVYLSPEDRQLLRAAIDRPINLYTDNARIAQSANAGNVMLAQRGMK